MASICSPTSAPSRDTDGSREGTAGAHNGFMFHFPSKVSSCVQQMNFQFVELWEQQQQLVAQRGTPVPVFPYSFQLLVSFFDKTKANKHPVRQQGKQPADSGREEDTWILSFLILSQLCGRGLDLWQTISLQLLIFCLPSADKIDRVHDILWGYVGINAMYIIQMQKAEKHKITTLKENTDKSLF